MEQNVDCPHCGDKAELQQTFATYYRKSDLNKIAPNKRRLTYNDAGHISTINIQFYACHRCHCCFGSEATDLWNQNNLPIFRGYNLSDWELLPDTYWKHVL
jgi:hypothetical protein